MGPLSQSVTFCDRGDGNPLPCFCLQNWTLFHLLFLLDNFAVIAWVDNTLGAMMLLKAFLSAPKKKYQIISWYMGNINLWFYQWLSGKESTWQCRRPGFGSWVRKIPWRMKWQLTPVFFPGKSHGQRSLVGYSSWGCKRVWHDWATKQQHSSTCVLHWSTIHLKIFILFLRIGVF